MQLGDLEENAPSPKHPHALTMLILYNRLKAWNILPVDGGLLDQPDLLMRFLEQIRLAYNDYREIQETNRRLDENADSRGEPHTLHVKIPLPMNPES